MGSFIDLSLSKYCKRFQTALIGISWESTQTTQSRLLEEVYLWLWFPSQIGRHGGNQMIGYRCYALKVRRHL